MGNRFCFRANGYKEVFICFVYKVDVESYNCKVLIEMNIMVMINYYNVILILFCKCNIIVV